MEATFPMNSAGFFGLHLVSAGSYEGDSYIEGPEGGAYRRLITRSGKLVGFILVGDVHASGIYTQLIREGTDLSEVDFELLKKSPLLLAYPRAARNHMLGERV